MSCSRIQMWDVAARQLVATFTGHAQRKYAIRSCFGGPDEVFVLSGSEDNMVHMWDAQSSKPIAQFAGHAGPVNAVAWSPLASNIFISASDDHRINVWHI